MNGKPQSVSIEKLNAAIAEATRTHKQFAAKDMRAGFLPDPGVFGYILKNPDLHMPLKDLQALATDITARAGVAGKPVSMVFDGDIIFGYFPVNEFTVFER